MLAPSACSNSSLSLPSMAVGARRNWRSDGSPDDVLTDLKPDYVPAQLDGGKVDRHTVFPVLRSTVVTAFCCHTTNDC